MSICMRLVTCAVLTLGLTTMAQANMITHGGFEAPGVSVSGSGIGIYTNTLMGAWTVTGSVGVINNSFNGELPTMDFTAQEGAQSLDLAGSGNPGPGTSSIAQAVNLIAGQSYALSFFVGRAGNGTNPSPYAGPASVGFGINGAALTTSISGTKTTGVPSPGLLNDINWFKFTEFFTADFTGLATISFSNQTPVPAAGSNLAGLDNVSLQAVPEPTSIAIFGFGMVCVVAGAGRMRRKV